jgi:hypothetical protein
MFSRKSFAVPALFYKFYFLQLKIKETNSRQEDCQKFLEEKNGRDARIKEFEKMLEQERREKRHIQSKLDGESKLKMVKNKILINKN